MPFEHWCFGPHPHHLGLVCDLMFHSKNWICTFTIHFHQLILMTSPRAHFCDLSPNIKAKIYTTITVFISYIYCPPSFFNEDRITSKFVWLFWTFPQTSTNIMLYKIDSALAQKISSFIMMIPPSLYPNRSTWSISQKVPLRVYYRLQCHDIFQLQKYGRVYGESQASPSLWEDIMLSYGRA